MDVRGAYRLQESAVTADEELRVHEAASPMGVLEAAGGSVFDADGNVTIHIIRPCTGRGRGSHVYEADMLQREAPKFSGWPMFIDHESPEQVRAKGNLPPSIFKLGGEVLESWWDPNVPAGGRFGQGAVVGKVKPSPWMKPVIEAHPRLVQASVNTFASGASSRRRAGRVENVVEGFVDEGSVDWVTRAGAGGGIQPNVLESVMEAWLETGDAQTDVANWLREHQPAVVEAVIKSNKPTSGEQEDDVDPKALMEGFNALSDDQRREVAEAVLNTDTGSTVIAEAVDERLKVVLPPAMEAAGAEVERAALAKVDLRLGHSSLMEQAQAKLNEAKLAEWARDDAWARLSESADFKPVEPDADGKGGKTALEVMEAAVKAEVERATKLQEAAGVKTEDAKPRVTAVTGNSGGDEHERETATVREGDSGYTHQEVLQEAGIDSREAYGLPPKAKADPDKPEKGAGE